MLYPVNTSSRMVVDLSGIWNFALDNGNGFTEKWYERPLENPMTMPVPSSYNDLKEGVSFRDHYGWVFYQRNISVPKLIRDTQRIMLRCDAVTHHGIVYLNGKELCRHEGGFLPFEVEIGQELHDGDNLLTIAVSNIIDYTTLPVGGESSMMGGGSPVGNAFKSERKINNPNFDFFNYCGLTRPVRIYTTPKAYIDDITLKPLINGKDACLQYEITLRCTETEEGNDKAAVTSPMPDSDSEETKKSECETSSSKENCTVRIYDEKRKLVAESFGTNGSIDIKDVHLWQPLNAYLYDIEVTFKEDVYTLPYGFRSVEVKGDKFLINGRPFYFKGYGKHEDTFPAGRGINIPMYVKDVSLMKWQGANSFRCSHYPYSEEMMRLADREGLVVIDETTAVGINFDFGGGANFQGKKVRTFDKEHGVKTFEHHKDVIRDLIERDKNYCSVVMWNIANEPDSYSKGAYEYFEPLFKLAKELDPEKRPCTLTSVQFEGGPDKDISGKLSDVICLNRYYGWYFGGPDLEGSEKALRNELSEWAKTGKPLMFTEYGADTVMGFHDTTPVMFTEEYQLEYYKMNNAVFDEFDFVVGEQVWNFADFATSQSIMRVQGNKKGLFTRDRKPKLAAHYFKERWTKIPDFDYKTK